jgi:hypothetical protein
VNAGKRAKPPAKLVIVRLDPVRGLALIKGPKSAAAVRYVGTDQQPPRWSASGNGYVTSYDGGLDVIAYGEMRGWIVRVSTSAPHDKENS